MSKSTRVLTGTAVLAAVVLILQFALGSIQIGPFTITLTMVPIIVGAALYGWATGAILGTIFGIVVVIQVITGAAGAGSTMMLELNPAATIIVCILKGMMAGLVAGLVADKLGKKNLWAGVLVAAIVAPVVNTGIFCIALVTIFGELAKLWAGEASSVAMFILTGIVGVNFVIELLVDIVLSPIILRIISAVKKSR